MTTQPQVNRDGMKTCKTCRYWEGIFGEGFYFCQRIKAGKAHLLKADMRREAATSGVFVDEGVCDVPLVTGPDFGCILHEERAKQIQNGGQA